MKGRGAGVGRTFVLNPISFLHKLVGRERIGLKIIHLYINIITSFRSHRGGVGGGKGGEREWKCMLNVKLGGVLLSLSFSII